MEAHASNCLVSNEALTWRRKMLSAEAQQVALKRTKTGLELFCSNS